MGSLKQADHTDDGVRVWEVRDNLEIPSSHIKPRKRLTSNQAFSRAKTSVAITCSQLGVTGDSLHLSQDVLCGYVNFSFRMDKNIEKSKFSPRLFTLRFALEIYDLNFKSTSFRRSLWTRGRIYRLDLNTLEITENAMHVSFPKAPILTCFISVCFV